MHSPLGAFIRHVFPFRIVFYSLNKVPLNVSKISQIHLQKFLKPHLESLTEAKNPNGIAIT